MMNDAKMHSKANPARTYNLPPFGVDENMVAPLPEQNQAIIYNNPVPVPAQNQQGPKNYDWMELITGWS